jgi:TIR domain
MTSKVPVFICYKKRLRHEDGSTSVDPVDSKSPILFTLLKESNSLLPWIDLYSLDPGADWGAVIADQIRRSDVVLALVERGTSKSPWVNREIAMAEALGITIVPIGAGLTDEQMLEECKALGIDKYQYSIVHGLRLGRGRVFLAEYEDTLLAGAAATKVAQRRILDDLQQRRRQVAPKAADNRAVASYDITRDGRAERAEVRVLATGNDPTI